MKGGTVSPFHALLGSGISTVYLRKADLPNPDITPLHVKVYIQLGRAALTLRYERWKEGRELEAAQAEAAAFLQVEQLRRLYQEAPPPNYI